MDKHISRRLRAVEDAPLALADAPEPDEQTDEWKQGWRACREVLGEEWAVWYARGLAARPLPTPALGWLLLVGATFVVAFILGAWTSP